MQFSSAILLLSTFVAGGAEENIHSFHPSQLLSRADFSKILYRSIDHDAVMLQHLNGRHLRGYNEIKIWNEMMQHGWTVAKSSPTNRILRSENVTFHAARNEPTPDQEEEDKHPFLICSSYPNESGYLRLQRILSAFNTTASFSQTVYNTEESSCFVLLTYSAVVERAFGDVSETRDGRMSTVTFGPLVDVLKFSAGTPSSILADEKWKPPSDTVNPSLRSGIVNSIQEEKLWIRSFMVDLISGSLEGTSADDESIEALSNDILKSVVAMAHVRPMHVKPVNETKLSLLRSFDIESSIDIPSVREAFSLTSTATELSNMKHRSLPNNIWSDALTNGFEAEHGCANMFDLLEVRPRGGVNATDSQDDHDDASMSVIGFELFLHGPQTSDQDILDSSAWNKQCVLSLIMGLSVHPSVQTIEMAQKLELASTDGNSNPQWITQSAIVDSRPFFDLGLDGSGQVVAVADGGLDRDNCYFRDATDSEGIFGGSWDMTQRKIVSYDDTFADRNEIPSGHGTYVSGIIAGRKSSDGVNDQIGYADGVAPGSKIHFFDMELGAAGIQDPGVSRLFASLYNSGSGAHVMNGSWGRSYGGQYTSFCRDYDTLLRTTYSNVLFVVSGGNTGMGGIKSSIQNPADCKNALAVGATLSYGNDIRSKEKGIDYLADYSSRGPSADGRIKPDIVGPGHFILAPNADPSSFAECDGSSTPNVQYSLSSGNGVKFVSGTSMSSPVIAGAAAIVRQYFEEGWCSSRWCCGSKACGDSINPSGSLLKAILMNGAQPLTGGVQQVPDGSVLADELSEYDNSQGFGRLNLLNSLPLSGENNLELIAINDKLIQNGAEHEYFVSVDASSGCNSDLRVTLAWYDPAGSIGCTNCVMNDVDLRMEEVDGSEIFFPNGLSYRDKKNTVERIRIQPSNGQQFRIVVHARNFATKFQRYSLAISGCLATDEQSAADASSESQVQKSTEAEQVVSAKSSVCSQSEESFELELRIHDALNNIKWDLIGQNVSKEIISSPDAAELGDNKTHHYSACLEPNRYRFKINNIGNATFKLTIGSEVILSSDTLEHPDNVYSFRFRVTADGYLPNQRKRTTIDGEVVRN